MAEGAEVGVRVAEGVPEGNEVAAAKVLLIEFAVSERSEYDTL